MYTRGGRVLAPNLQSIAEITTTPPAEQTDRVKNEESEELGPPFLDSLETNSLPRRGRRQCLFPDCASIELGPVTAEWVERHIQSEHPLLLDSNNAYRCHVPGCDANDELWVRSDYLREHFRLVHRINSYDGLERTIRQNASEFGIPSDVPAHLAERIRSQLKQVHDGAVVESPKTSVGLQAWDISNGEGDNPMAIGVDGRMISFPGPSSEDLNSNTDLHVHDTSENPKRANSRRTYPSVDVLLAATPDIPPGTSFAGLLHIADSTTKKADVFLKYSERPDRALQEWAKASYIMEHLIPKRYKDLDPDIWEPFPGAAAELERLKKWMTDAKPIFKDVRKIINEHNSDVFELERLSSSLTAFTEVKPTSSNTAQKPIDSETQYSRKSPHFINLQNSSEEAPPQLPQVDKEERSSSLPRSITKKLDRNSTLGDLEDFRRPRKLNRSSTIDDLDDLKAVAMAGFSEEGRDTKKEKRTGGLFSFFGSRSGSGSTSREDSSKLSRNNPDTIKKKKKKRSDSLGLIGRIGSPSQATSGLTQVSLAEINGRFTHWDSTTGLDQQVPSIPIVSTETGQFTRMDSTTGLDQQVPPIPIVSTETVAGTSHIHKVYTKDEQIPYEFVKQLGHGSLGVVDAVRSKEAQDGIIFARKTIQLRNVTRKKLLPLIQQEVAVLKSLNHHHIVKVLDTYETSARPRSFGILLSPAGDEDFSHFLERVGENNSSDEELQLLNKWQICMTSAIAYIHSQNIRHKDIKPSNMICKGSEIYLTDFGSAHQFNTGLTSSTEGPLVGITRMYSAPEVIANDRRGRPADIFSLGCVFAEMASVVDGKTVEEFEDYRTVPVEDEPETLTSVYHATAPRILTWFTDLGDGWTASLLEDMLAADHKRRPTADALMKILREHYGEQTCPCQKIVHEKIELNTS